MSGEAPIKATLKAGAGYDVPWLTIDADNPNDLEQKLRGIIDSKVLETVAEAASMFQATQNAAPLTQAAPAQQEQPQWSQPQQQAAPQQQNQGWGAAQQQAPQQQQYGGGGGGGTSQYGAQLHPEGLACHCGEVLQYGKTRTNKGQWKCPQYRYNNGNPNDHRLEWA
jgi:hypothetical protein